PAALLDVALQLDVLYDRVRRRKLLHRLDRGGNRLDRRLRLALERSYAGDERTVTTHPSRTEEDRVLELRVRVERRVDLIPEPCRRQHGLAAADLDRQRRGDLVGGAAEDDELSGQLIPQVGQRERRRDYAARNRIVPARVHRLDRAVRAEDRDGVVEADEADRAARERALQH